MADQPNSPNRLAQETSPYLLQHAGNPVDWYPWGPEALERARRENKPILLSIGYAACHWCHVMAHESFEDEATAALMNERFVNIKVDREERPDLDGIYMQAVQALTGHGGWPMTVFLTPEGAPFYGGTYYPKEDRHGMPSFQRILLAVSDAYHTRRDDIARSAESLRELYANAAAPARSAGPLSPEVLDRAYRAFSDRYDDVHGGLDGAPKFPPTMSLEVLLRHWARRGAEHALAMVRGTFGGMARGGIYDQIGGGFARYTVDDAWLVPHFEKMLYDNALLIQLGAHLWQATGDGGVRRIVEETVAWAAREMRSPEGGFYSSLDADSGGHEGAFYVWSADEFDRVLESDAPPLRTYWGVTPGGNFEGKNILTAAADARAVAARFGLSETELAAAVARGRQRLYDVRAARVWPGRDEKILTSWNGWMVRAIAEAARAFGDAGMQSIAVESGTFLFARLVSDDGRVFRTVTGDRARIAGYLEDYASLGLAALALYELTFDAAWLAQARRMADSAVRWFWSDETSAFYDTAADHETLITRPREVADNATPSGTSLVVELLLRIAELFQDADARRRATYVLETLAPAMQRYPSAFGHLLGSADMAIHGAVELAIVGEPGAPDFVALERTAAERYVPSLVLAGGPPAAGDALPFLAGREMRDGRATAYLCRNYACDEPATAGARLGEQIDAVALGSRGRDEGSKL